MKVKIPFLERFREPMLKGTKTMTSRTRKYGEKGDTFDAFGATFELEDVRKVSLFCIANYYYRQEGADSTQDFINIWKIIHPRKGFDSDMMVWLHRFKKVNMNEFAPKPNRFWRCIPSFEGRNQKGMKDD